MKQLRFIGRCIAPFVEMVLLVLLICITLSGCSSTGSIGGAGDGPRTEIPDVTVEGRTGTYALVDGVWTYRPPADRPPG